MIIIRRIFSAMIVAVFLSGCSAYIAPKNTLHTTTSFYNEVSFNSFLLKNTSQVALWLGRKVDNKYLVEPINVIILDEESRSDEESISLVETALDDAGYNKRCGHSSGYIGVINKKPFKQVPREFSIAYSNNNFWKINNHGRLFGPYTVKAKERMYIGQFSRESFSLFSLVNHGYVSFSAARDDFIKKVTQCASLKYIDNIDALNKISSNIFTSKDHDGKIKVLLLKK